MYAQTRGKISKDEIHTIVLDPPQLHGSVDRIDPDTNAVGVGIVHMTLPELRAAVDHGRCAETPGNCRWPPCCIAHWQHECAEVNRARNGGELYQEPVVE